MSQSTRITCDEIEEFTPQELLALVRGTNGAVELIVPLPNIGVTGDPGNIAIDYAEALSVGEALANLSSSIECSRVYSDRSSSVRFSFVLDKVEEGTELLYDLMRGLYIDGDEWAHSVASELEERLFSQDPSLTLRFPDLADDYMANLLHAADVWDDTPGSRTRYQKQFPETKFGYWKSFASTRFGFPLYCSSEAWVAPPNVDLTVAISSYGFGEPRPQISFDPAQITKIDGQPALLVSDCQAVPVPQSAILDATRFTSALQPFGRQREVKGKNWLLSKCGEVAVMRSPLGQHAGFCDQHVTGTRVLTAYMERCEDVADRLRRLLGVAIHTPCVWNKFDDELFEQLCYDLTRRLPRFDPSSVRKMGTSRSRDGGRDIVAMTRTRPGSEPRRWIIQCKLVTSRRSLAGNSINVSDTIDQYGAAGYMVFTNAVIDATLYDKLEAIGKNRSIDVDAWSGMEVERFLQGHRDLLERYF